MKPTRENIVARRRFLTPELFVKLSSGRDDGHDYFTNSGNYPRTFKIGACRENNPSDTDFNLDVYWRDDKNTVQNELLLTLLKTEDGWLIDRVTPNKP